MRAVAALVAITVVLLAGPLPGVAAAGEPAAAPSGAAAGCGHVGMVTMWIAGAPDQRGAPARRRLTGGYPRSRIPAEPPGGRP